MKKTDIILCAAILAGAAVWLLFLSIKTSDNLTAHIYIKGDLHASVDTSNTAELYDTGTNLVQIESGGVYMLFSTCRSQDCIRMGKITRPGQMIVCLPNRVIVMLDGAGEAQYDAVAG